MESVGFAEEEELLKCFRCDLGFWDACYTTETNCSFGERCYTGRGKAGALDKIVLGSAKVIRVNAFSDADTEYHHLVSLADVLDVKTLGCVKAEECNVETMVELFPDKTVFVMTKHCCDTPFCNSARKLPIQALLYLTVALLITWHISEASAVSQ